MERAQMEQEITYVSVRKNDDVREDLTIPPKLKTIKIKNK